MWYGIVEEPEKCPECKEGHMVVIIEENQKSEQCDSCGFEQKKVEIFPLLGV